MPPGYGRYLVGVAGGIATPTLSFVLPLNLLSPYVTTVPPAKLMPFVLFVTRQFEMREVPATKAMPLTWPVVSTPSSSAPRPPVLTPTPVVVLCMKDEFLMIAFE